MKRFFLLMICLLLILGACATPVSDRAGGQTESAQESPPDEGAVYLPDRTLSVEETVAAYFEQQYIGYTTLEFVDFGVLLDLEAQSNRNLITWVETLVQRRRLLEETGLCYVDTQQYDYTIRYLDEADLLDERMEFWRNWGGDFIDEGRLVHFTITGAPDAVFPPMFAANTQHTIRLNEIDGMWKITMHYYPGSVRKYRSRAMLELPDEEMMRAALYEEFAQHPETAQRDIPAGAVLYSGQNAAVYARAFTQMQNPAFYNIGDWMGNCANFTSQCICYGFAGDSAFDDLQAHMTASWYAGNGGGSPAWENVGHFWDYAAQGQELVCEQLPGARALQAGDMIQIGSGSMPGDAETDDEDEEKFNHSLVVVDSETLLLGQNSPGCFVYYSDLVNVRTRFLRPLYLLD